MWNENLLILIKEKKLNKHQIAERGNLPYETVKRIVNGETLNPTIETLDRFAMALDCSLSDILIGTNTFVGTKRLADLQAQVDCLVKKVESLKAERDFAVADNAILKDENKTLSAKIDLLNMQLAYKDEIIALHKIIEQTKG